MKEKQQQHSLASSNNGRKQAKSVYNSRDFLSQIPGELLGQDFSAWTIVNVLRETGSALLLCVHGRFLKERLGIVQYQGFFQYLIHVRHQRQLDSL